jgi:putative exporter of polyketide antibiotics
VSRRPILELVVLAFTVTVCGVMLLLAVSVTVAGIIPPNDPASDRYVLLLASGTATLLGALLGLVAGRRATGPPAGPAGQPQAPTRR